jgi:hypothetical protein
MCSPISHKLNIAFSILHFGPREEKKKIRFRIFPFGLGDLPI